MSRAANPAVVGGFVIGAITLIVASVLVFGSGRLFQDRLAAVAYFAGNVRGLQEGSLVEFRGVRVGTVRAIRLVYDAAAKEMRIPVLLELEPARLAIVGDSGEPGSGRGDDEDRLFLDALVAQGLRARLELKSFVTGQLALSLDMYPDTPVQRVGADGSLYELPTLPSTLDRVSQLLEDLPLAEVAAKIISALDHTERLLSAPELGETIRHVRDTAASSAALMGGLEAHVVPLARSAQLAAEDAHRVLLGVESRVDETLLAYRDLAQHSDSSVARMAGQMEATLADVAKLSRTTDERLAALVATATGALQRAGVALDGVAGLTAEDSRTRQNLDRTLEELAGAARALRIMAEYIERNPDALLRGKGTR